VSKVFPVTVRHGLARKKLIGVTLPEILIACLITGTVLIPLLKHITTSLWSVDELLLYQWATVLNTNALERYRNQPFEQLTHISGAIPIAVPSHLRNRLATTLRVKDRIPGRLVEIQVGTTLLTRTGFSVEMFTFVANQAPDTGVTR